MQHKIFVISSATSSLYKLSCGGCGTMWIKDTFYWLWNSSSVNARNFVDKLYMRFSHLVDADMNLNINFNHWMLEIERLECSCCAHVIRSSLESHSYQSTWNCSLIDITFTDLPLIVYFHVNRRYYIILKIVIACHENYARRLYRCYRPT